MASNVLSNAAVNAKTIKSLKSGEYVGAILYLTPSNGAGLGNICPFASPGCKAGCLYTAGRGTYDNVKQGRLRKTRLFFQNKPLFFSTLYAEITALEKRAEKKGVKAFVRLNGTSDICWEAFRPYDGKTVFEAFPGVQFYDYTKDIKKALGNTIPNYHLTFSRSECNMGQVEQALAAGINVAVVFKGKVLPKTYLGRKVLNGDKTDLRFEEGNQGAIVGLIAKGKARKDNSGFVVDPGLTLLEKA